MNTCLRFSALARQGELVPGPRGKSLPGRALLPLQQPGQRARLGAKQPFRERFISAGPRGLHEHGRWHEGNGKVRSDGAEIICFGGSPDFHLLGGITGRVSGAAAGAGMQGSTHGLFFCLPGVQLQLHGTSGADRALEQGSWRRTWWQHHAVPSCEGVARHQATGSGFVTPHYPVHAAHAGARNATIKRPW